MADNDFGMTIEDFEEAATLGGISMKNVQRNDDGTYSYVPMPRVPEDDVKALLAEMGEAAFSPDPDAFAVFVAQNKKRLSDAAAYSDEVSRMVVCGYQVGISAGSSTCMNDLGALYYMGDLVEQDYAKAAELYQMAMEHGCFQSIVNLGYIWEYGRLGEKDYAKAFEYYALAASLCYSFEAAYKLGDMYARGYFVERDIAKAYQLWNRSLNIAEGITEIAQPAFRIAQLLISDECEKAHVEPDAMLALHLFQQAEVGLRIDIADGQFYYADRLKEAIEGQQKARNILDTRILDGE